MKTCVDCDWNNNNICCVMSSPRPTITASTPACQFHKHSEQVELPLEESKDKKKRQLLKD